jgi:hypothetical protein
MEAAGLKRHFVQVLKKCFAPEVYASLNKEEFAEC